MSDEVMEGQMDTSFGKLRPAIGNADADHNGRQPWEVGAVPISTSTLNPELGRSLQLLLQAASTDLLQTASKSLTFLWGMESDGSLKLAVEEVARINGETVPMGFPTRRGLRKDLTLDDKLGHPCIMSTNQARIAGELYIDKAESNGGGLVWTLNARSGRFHEPPERRPSREQLSNVAQRFAAEIGASIEIERVRDFSPFNPTDGRPV